MNERCLALLLNKMPSKEKYPGSFTIPCQVSNLQIDNALAYLGASISLMPYTMYEKFGLEEPKPTRMSLELADRSIQYPRGIVENVLIKVDKIFIPIDFVILDMPEDFRIPIILGRPFLATARAVIDIFNKKITLRVGDDEVIFNMDQSMKKPCTEDDECYNKFTRDSDIDIAIRHTNSTDMAYSDEQGTDGTNTIKNEHLYLASANKIDEKKPELKDLPSHLEYAYLHGNECFPIIISSKLSKREKKSLLQVLEKHKGEIAWKMSDIKGIIQNVVKNEIVNLIDSELIYPISESSWVSLIHVVPKRGGMTVVLNDNNELIPSHMVTGWRVCNDYRKLNDATRKDHFPLPFIDQMLERLSGNDYYCFLDGFSGFFQILIALEDQETTTFTCTYGTFAYRRMSFGLCNARATFQRCMTAIFHDMVDVFMEVFMDSFSVFERIVLGHKISGSIEVDKAKINVIAKLPYPANVKGVRSFLGHVGCYHRFINDFSMISRPMTQLLLKDVKFGLSDDCKKAFNILKEKLTTAHIIISPDWNIPFELMCDASDFVVGVVLGQRVDGKFKPIYYARKTLNNAQEHYTTTEKELLVVVFAFDKFRPYLILLKTMVYTDHSALKAENLVADHLSRLENPHMEVLTEREIADEFPGKHLMMLKAKLNDIEPWYADYVNYIVGKVVPPKWTSERRKSEIFKILAHCHSRPTEGHHSASVTRIKRSGNISSRSEMPQNNIQVCEVFDIWGLHFMGPSPD
ncbi:putative nucleotidyltransferase, ribonuclease H [Tanacetum coccineum]